MANYTYSADLINSALFLAGESTDGLSDFQDRALELLNRSYRAIWMGGTEIDPTLNEEWWWLRKSTPGVITLLPREEHTASVTNNSASITFSATIADSKVGWHFRAEDTADVFRISTHVAGTAAATLDSVFTGTTNAAVSSGRSP